MMVACKTLEWGGCRGVQNPCDNESALDSQFCRGRFCWLVISEEEEEEKIEQGKDCEERDWKTLAYHFSLPDRKTFFYDSFANVM